MEWITTIYFSIATFMFLIGHFGCWAQMFRMKDLKTNHKVMRLSTFAKVLNLNWYIMGVIAAFMTCYQVMEALNLPLMVKYEVSPMLNDQSWAVLTGMWIGSLTHGYSKWINSSVAEFIEELVVKFVNNLYLRNPNQQ